MKTIASLPLIMLVALATGCSSSSGIPVHGTVSLEDGTPLTGGAVFFSDSANNTSSSGAIREDGSFKLGTLEPGDGAPAGKYKVTISPPTDPATDRVLIPINPDYQNPLQTPLEVEVTPENFVFDLKVESPSKRRR